MPRGRPPNPFRAAAREAGSKFYKGRDPCPVCDTNLRYTKNTACVACTIEHSRAYYAGLDDEQKAAHKAADHDRYMRQTNRP